MMNEPLVVDSSELFICRFLIQNQFNKKEHCADQMYLLRN